MSPEPNQGAAFQIFGGSCKCEIDKNGEKQYTPTLKWGEFVPQDIQIRRTSQRIYKRGQEFYISSYDRQPK